jgi:hypothetical protein
MKKPCSRVKPQEAKLVEKENNKCKIWHMVGPIKHRILPPVTNEHDVQYQLSNDYGRSFRI